MFRNKANASVSILMVLLIASAAWAQPDDDAKKPERGQTVMIGTAAGAVTGPGIARFDINTVKGQPYSAIAESETVQTLADGNRIVQRSTSQIYRDSEGRTRQEFDSGLPGAANSPRMQIISITDPNAGFSYTLHPDAKTAEKLQFMDPESGIFSVSVPPPDGGVVKGRVNMMYFKTGVAAEGDAMAPPGEPPHTVRIFVQGPSTLDPQKANEQLGTRIMEGIEVEGKRTTTTIPAGQIGNEKPITITTESWYSPELQVVMYSMRDDPMMGTTTYRLTKVNRDEPDAMLFRVPSDYTILEPQIQLMKTTKPK